MVLNNSHLFTNDRVYCGSMLTSIETKVNTGTYYICVIDMSISVLDFLLYLYNKRQIQMYKKLVFIDKMSIKKIIFLDAPITLIWNVHLT